MPFNHSYIRLDDKGRFEVRHPDTGLVTLYPRDLVRAILELDEVSRNGDLRALRAYPIGYNNFVEAFNADDDCPYRLSLLGEQAGDIIIVGRRPPMDDILPPAAPAPAARAQVEDVDPYTARRQAVADQAVYDFALYKQNQDRRFSMARADRLKKKREADLSFASATPAKKHRADAPISSSQTVSSSISAPSPASGSSTDVSPTTTTPSGSGSGSGTAMGTRVTVSSSVKAKAGSKNVSKEKDTGKDTEKDAGRRGGRGRDAMDED